MKFMSRRPTNELSRFARRHNEATWAIYRSLPGSPGNLFFSPFSLRSALAMAYAGARGETAEQMARVLCFEPGEVTHRALAELSRYLTAKADAYELVSASSLWSQEEPPLEADYLALMAAHYESAAFAVDFARQAETVRREINTWVEQKTRQRIRDLVPPHGLGSDTDLVLVNAIFFKGLWRHPFPERFTRKQPFYLANGETAKIRLMYTKSRVDYFESEDFQMVELDYRGDELSMMVILPRQKGGLAALEPMLSADALENAVRQSTRCEVEIYLPRFELSWGTYDLVPYFRALGMEKALGPRADFSGLRSGGGIFITNIFHQAFVEVNEKGTEASAATAVALSRGAPVDLPPTPVFRADHPFLYAIREQRTGTILFLGRLDEPSD